MLEPIRIPILAEDSKIASVKAILAIDIDIVKPIPAKQLIKK